MNLFACVKSQNESESIYKRAATPLPLRDSCPSSLKATVRWLAFVLPVLIRMQFLLFCKRNLVQMCWFSLSVFQGDFYSFEGEPFWIQFWLSFFFIFLFLFRVKDWGFENSERLDFCISSNIRMNFFFSYSSFPYKIMLIMIAVYMCVQRYALIRRNPREQMICRHLINKNLLLIAGREGALVLTSWRREKIVHLQIHQNLAIHF